MDVGQQGAWEGVARQLSPSHASCEQYVETVLINVIWLQEDNTHNVLTQTASTNSNARLDVMARPAVHVPSRHMKLLPETSEEAPAGHAGLQTVKSWCHTTLVQWLTSSCWSSSN